MICTDHKRCSSRPSADRPNYDLAKVFFVALRGQKEVAVAVAVLRGPPCPPRTKCCRCSSSWTLVALRGQKSSSPRPSVSSADKSFVALRGQKEVALRGPSWTKGSCSRRCSSPRPSVSSADKCVAVAVLRGPSWPLRGPRGQMCCRCSSRSVLRGPPCPFVDKCVAVAVLRGPSRPFSCPPRTNVLPLQFFAALRGWTNL